MTDRICIASKGNSNAHISAEDLVDCCITCGFGCNGGFPEAAWEHFAKTGLVTGGNFNTGEGCEPYTIPSCSHHVNGFVLFFLALIKRDRCDNKFKNSPMSRFLARQSSTIVNLDKLTF